MRPRTLPLALSGIIAGSFIALAEHKYKWIVIIMSTITAIFLQILSNLANDYGDAVKGTDNEKRVGPVRTVQSGRITPQQMKNATILFSLFSLISGLALLYFAFGDKLWLALIFLVLGLGAIAAAIKYTMGEHAYGYKGWGDLFVFLFFGLTGVIGAWFLNTLYWRYDILLPASALGFLSTGVLNLNNMRDMDNDLASGKRSIASRLGYPKARIYHAILIFLGFILSFIYVVMNYKSIWNYLFLLTLPLFLKDLVAIFKMKDKSLLDPFLKKLALSTLLFSVLFGIGLLL
ncbi:MAG: 1,4-dihydroxy-2-naphthoate polyprenyltransferase [Bacteroidales bacterium]|nr:1,4-dihydroxy-2-naphthoate polyprenyltransferase [Bacteroidales bacterium]